jgi:hypothetical protein
LFNFVVMQSLFYIPFFLIGALAFIHPKLKSLFTTPSPWCAWVPPRVRGLSAEPALRQRRRLDV